MEPSLVDTNGILSSISGVSLSQGLLMYRGLVSTWTMEVSSQMSDQRCSITGYLMNS